MSIKSVEAGCNNIKPLTFPRLMKSRNSGAVFLVHSRSYNSEFFAATVVHGKTGLGRTVGYCCERFSPFSALEDYTGSITLCND